MLITSLRKKLYIDICFTASLVLAIGLFAYSDKFLINSQNEAAIHVMQMGIKCDTYIIVYTNHISAWIVST